MVAFLCSGGRGGRRGCGRDAGRLVDRLRMASILSGGMRRGELGGTGKKEE